jgi:hypothetical protein
LLPLHLARAAAGKVRPTGTLLFMGGTGGRRPGLGLALPGALTAALPALIANLALELAPSGSTSSPPGSSTHRCRPGSSATTWTSVAISYAPRCRSGESSGQPT